MRPADRKKLEEDEYEGYFNGIWENIQNQDDKKKILIFVHGGLNRFNNALNRANDLYQEILKDGYYPIFIIWDSSLLRSYLDHLLWIRQGRVYRCWGPLTFPFYLLADFGRGPIRAPIVIFHQLSTDVYSTFPDYFPSYKNGEVLYKELEKRYKNGNNQQYEIAISLGSDNRSFINKGSLLEWIDNFLASPQTTLDRTLGKWENIIQATHIIPEETRGQVNIKAFIAGPDSRKEYQEGNPQKHADFTKKEIAFWKETFWKPKEPK